MTTDNRTVTVKLEADTTGYSEAMAEATRLANELADALERINNTRISVKAERVRTETPSESPRSRVLQRFGIEHEARFDETVEWEVTPQKDYAAEALRKAQAEYEKRHGIEACAALRWIVKPKG